MPEPKLPPTPPPSSVAASAVGRANRGRDTLPERRLRSELHRLGLRFRVNRRVSKRLRGTVDIVFGPTRIAVFVDGCFWHRCPEHFHMPKANRDWWEAKLQANVDRDRRVERTLEEEGWTVVRVWEHEDAGVAAKRIETCVRARRGRDA